MKDARPSLRIRAYRIVLPAQACIQKKTGLPPKPVPVKTGAGVTRGIGGDKHGQNGNAVVFVLLGIVLFGLLSYTLINSAKMGQGNLTNHQANLAAQEIIAYAQVIERGYDKLRQRGCAEKEISFYHASMSFHSFYVNLYNNPSAPADRSCHMFYPEGANVTYIQTPPNIEQISSLKTFVPAAVLTTDYRNPYHYVMRGQVRDLGNINTNDLAFSFSYIKKEVCEALNQQLMGNATIYNTRYGSFLDVYRNTFTLDGISDTYMTPGLGSNGHSIELRGVKAACYQNIDTPGLYALYYVFSVR